MNHYFRCLWLICACLSSFAQDRESKYLFYLHGKIVEDQGPLAVSEKYGAYQYEAIVSSLEARGFRVMGEVRPRDTRPAEYAAIIVKQISDLIEVGVPPTKITVVGASKGAGIAVLISHLLRHQDVNFVVMAVCNDQMHEFWRANQIRLWGRVLYLYDHADVIAGSCRPYLEDLRSEGLTAYDEIELQVGAGHGILYRPLEEWIEPVVSWSDP